MATATVIAVSRPLLRETSHNRHTPTVAGRIFFDFFFFFFPHLSGKPRIRWRTARIRPSRIFCARRERARYSGAISPSCRRPRGSSRISILRPYVTRQRRRFSGCCREGMTVGGGGGGGRVADKRHGSVRWGGGWGCGRPIDPTRVRRRSTKTSVCPVHRDPTIAARASRRFLVRLKRPASPSVPTFLSLFFFSLSLSLSLPHSLSRFAALVIFHHSGASIRVCVVCVCVDRF